MPRAEAKISLGSVPNALSITPVFPPSSALFFLPTPFRRPIPPPLLYYPPPSPLPSLSYPAASLRPVNSGPTYSHNRLVTYEPGLSSASRHRSIIGRVEMYYMAVFWSLDRLNQGNLAVSFEPGRSLRRRHLFDLCFRELQDMSNPRNPQAS